MSLYTLVGELHGSSEGFLNFFGRACTKIGSETVQLGTLVNELAKNSTDFHKYVHSNKELEMVEGAILRIENLYAQAHRKEYFLHPLTYLSEWIDHLIYKDIERLESVKSCFATFKCSIPSWTSIAQDALAIHGETPFADGLIEKVCELANKKAKTGVTIGVFPLTNESLTWITLNKLKPNKGVHIGFSGWFNFDIMAKKKTEYSVLCDFNVNVTHFMRASLFYLKKSANRSEFVSNIKPYMADQDEKLGFVKTINVNYESREEIRAADKIEGELKKEDGWLGSDQAYNHIKMMAESGKIAAITANIVDEKLFFQIRDVFEREDQKVTSLYLSNVLQYCTGVQEKASFYGTIEALSCDETELIAAAGIRQYTACYGELIATKHFFEDPFYRKFLDRL